MRTALFRAWETVLWRRCLERARQWLATGAAFLNTMMSPDACVDRRSLEAYFRRGAARLLAVIARASPFVIERRKLYIHDLLLPGSCIELVGFCEARIL